MLSFFRKKKVARAIFWGLLVLILPAFVIWGAGSMSESRKKGPKYVGIIRGKQVSYSKFIAAVQDARHHLIINYWNQPEALNAVMGDRSSLARFAWQRLIFLSGAEQAGLTVSDQEVVQFITHHPLFQRSGGFDRSVYEYFLKYNFGSSARAFEEFARDYLRIAKLEDSITKDITASEEEALQEYTRERQRVKIQCVMIDHADFAKEVKVTDDMIFEHFQKNSGQYYVPEMVQVSYVSFPIANPEGEIAAIRQAEDFVVEVAGNPDRFQEAAQEKDLRIKESAPFTRDEMPDGLTPSREFQDAAFGLPEGQVSGLIIPQDPNRTNCYVLKVIRRIPKRQANLIEAREAVRDRLALEGASAVSRTRAGEIRRTIAQTIAERGVTFDEATAQLPVRFVQTDLFSRNDTNEAIGALAPVWDVAFRLKAGELSQPVETGRGFCIFTPSVFEYANAEDFQKEKEKFLRLVLARKKNLTIDEWFRTAAVQADLTVDLDTLDQRYR